MFDPVKFLKDNFGKWRTEAEAWKTLDNLTIPQQHAVLKVWKAWQAEFTGEGKSKIPEDPASFAEKYSALYGGSQGRDHIWRRARHLDKVNEYLIDIATGKRRRVMISMAPRHGKTELITYWNTIWRLARNPATRIALCGYSADFIANYGRWIRNFIRDHGTDIGVALDPSSTAAYSWQTTAGGGVHTVGRGGPLSGMGFDLVIVDDPYKGLEEANSEAIRKAAWDWWEGTVFARKEARTSYLIVQTRWNMDDISGRLERLSKSGEGLPWDIIKLKAIAEDADDPLGRAPGEVLWPEGIPESELLDTKKASSPHIWSALYQQEPIPSEGNMFPFGWWQYYEVLPDKLDIMVQSWDFSFKDAKKSDFVVGQVWGRRGASYYLVDQIRARMSAKDSITAIKAFTAKYPQARAKLFEDKANGPALKALLQEEVGGIIPIQPRGSKEARAAAMSPFVQAGNVFLPRQSIAPWVADLLMEFGQFPNGANDDIVDAAVQAINWLAPGGYLTMASARRQAEKMNSSYGQTPQKALEARIAQATQKAIDAKAKELTAKPSGKVWNS